MQANTSIIKLRDLAVRYGDLQVIWGISLEIPREQITCILGSNGSGKSTVMNSISGLVQPFAGEICLDDEPLHTVPAHQRVALGVAHVPERRRVFSMMSVLENLLLGAYVPRAKEKRAESLDWVLELFPILAERQNQRAGSLSGGEQQMLAIARGLMSRPRVIMLDQPFLGLSPVMVDQVIKVLLQLREQGLTVIFIEQHLNLSLEISQQVYVLEQGQVLLQGDGAQLLRDGTVERAYMGLV